MTIGMETATTRRMGRPPLKRNVPTIVMALRLPADDAGRIDEIAGDGKRADWIRAVIRKELRAIKASPPTAPGSTKSKDAE